MEQPVGRVKVRTHLKSVFERRTECDKSSNYRRCYRGMQPNLRALVRAII